MNTISPRVLKGFRDFLPFDQRLRETMIDNFRHTFQQFGFFPIDTPILEYSEILLGKGGSETDKQIYRFRDQGDRDVAMRFDLTVPLARYVAQHYHKLNFPLRRYHVGKVFRGENSQRGRFREFIQCDFDIIAADSPYADYEILALSQHALRLFGNKLEIHISHRDVLPTCIQSLPIHNEMMHAITQIRSWIDKIHKIGKDAVQSAIAQLVGAAEQKYLPRLMDVIMLSRKKMRFADAIDALQELIPRTPENADSRQKLMRYFTILNQYLTHNIGQASAVLDPSITRGLNYYTGLVFEIYHIDEAQIGAIASGGRYDQLTALYGIDSLPAVGGSIGIDRILSIIGQNHFTNIPKHAILFMQNSEHIPMYIDVAQQLRNNEINAEIYPMSHPLKKQFQFAEKNSYQFGLFLHISETGENLLELRDLKSRKTFNNISIDEICKRVKHPS